MRRQHLAWRLLVADHATLIAGFLLRVFVGTDSRLLRLFDLFKQMRQGNETDPQVRVRQLYKCCDAIDDDIARALAEF